MADNKMVKEITAMEVDFAKWYTDVVKKADLADYSSVRGCMIVRPYGYAIWENCQKILDTRFKELGHCNVAMPMFIPESLLQKEKDHVEGFAPEVAWVTHGGTEKLAERLCVRPTSETLFCEHYKNIVESYRDLPKLYNQWCSVVRWEKTTRPFLRTLEFFWQEGHTIHATAEEAIAETEQMLGVYADFLEGSLAIPVIKGRKTDKEKFAGAEITYTVEAMMHDGKALQSGTSHYFGDGFARAFEIQYQDKDNKLQYPHQTSWGMSTRIIGGIIMTHGDDNGLVLPPAIAPTQAVIIPIAAHKGGVIEKAEELLKTLKEAGVRVSVDSSDQSPGWKFAEYEMKGVPLRVEIGPRDIEAGTCVIVARDNREKTVCAIDDIAEKVKEELKNLHNRIFEKAKKNREERSFTAANLDEIMRYADGKGCFITTQWCGDRACEELLKEKAGLTSRCMPFGAEPVGDTCPICGKKGDKTIIWGKAY